MTIQLSPEPEIAERLEKLCQIANLEASEVINILLDSPLEQIIKYRDSSLLRCCVHPSVDATLKKMESSSLFSDRRRITPMGYELVVESGFSGFRHQGASPGAPRCHFYGFASDFVETRGGAKRRCIWSNTAPRSRRISAASSAASG
jgi:hypothetical protein